jgi:hypothetical protein
MIQAGTGNIYFCTNTGPDAAGTVFSLAERMHIAFLRQRRHRPGTDRLQTDRRGRHLRQRQLAAHL